MRSGKHPRIPADTLRLIDANINRFSEGARVAEDIMRFVLNDPRLTRRWKAIRHELREAFARGVLSSRVELCSYRDVHGDVGKPSTRAEMKRHTMLDILIANIQRAKESLRVMEEFAKLYDRRTSAAIKAARYRVYALEKSSLEKALRVCDNEHR